VINGVILLMDVISLRDVIEIKFMVLLRPYCWIKVEINLGKVKAMLYGLMKNKLK